MKLGSPLPHRKARIEIVPLIDIMFFLLASFMLVSLSMIQMRGIKINMPSAATSVPEQKMDFISVTVDVVGDIFIEKDKVAPENLVAEFKKLVTNNPETRIYIRADKDSTHGSVITVLDKIKIAGITKVAFEIKPQALGTENRPGPDTQPLTPPSANTAPPPDPSAPVPPVPAPAAAQPAATP